MHDFKEHSLPQQYHHHQPALSEQNKFKQDQFASDTMDSSFQLFDSLPFTMEMFGNMDQQDIKYEMLRSMSQGSIQQNYADGAPSLLSSTSGASLPSAASSNMGSPYSGHAQPTTSQYMYPNEYVAAPTILCEEPFPYGHESAHFDTGSDGAFSVKMTPPFVVDPIMISSRQPTIFNSHPVNYLPPQQQQQQQQPRYSPAPSPAPSSQSYGSFGNLVNVDSRGVQHPQSSTMRRPSNSSLRSAGSPQSTYSADDDSRDKGRCPYPDCGRVFKDLKAHMMTHETVRPEKCPIVSCDYHKKGFARKYDKNRHTLTHWRGTMICGFCPGSGSAAERSFNRADVFKKHLTTVHGVEQTPPNSRKRNSTKAVMNLSNYCVDATGKCSTCGSAFNNAQEFYEHLDDCVLRVVQQEDPIEAVNARRLGEIMNDSDVQATFERNNIKSEDSVASVEDDEDEDDEDEDEDEDEDMFEQNERSGRGVIKVTKVTSNRPIIGGNISKKTSKKGLTWSKGGGSIIGKSRKRRKFYPPSWGMATDKMNMRNRVLCVYDGPRRLLKDDMMMHNEFEVRLPLQDRNSYVTDMDLETMKRAVAFHNATPEEKGPWIPDTDFLSEYCHE